jgi:hypothetical protein
MAIKQNTKLETTELLFNQVKALVDVVAEASAPDDGKRQNEVRIDLFHHLAVNCHLQEQIYCAAAGVKFEQAPWAIIDPKILEQMMQTEDGNDADV